MFQGNNRSRACRVSPLCHPGSMQRLGAGCCITVTTIFNIYGSGGWGVGNRIKNLENWGFVLHPHSTTLNVIRLVVPGTLIGTPVMSATRSPAFAKSASGVYAHRQTSCPIPRSIMVCCRAGMMRERQGGGLRAGGAVRDMAAAARSTILTDEWIAVSVRGVGAPHH